MYQTLSSRDPRTIYLLNSFNSLQVHRIYKMSNCATDILLPLTKFTVVDNYVKVVVKILYSDFTTNCLCRSGVVMMDF